MSKTPLTILLDGRTIKAKPSGVGAWNIQLAKNLLAAQAIVHLLIAQDCTYPFDSDATFKAAKQNGKLHLVTATHSYNFVQLDRFIFEQTKLRKIIENVNPDIYHATDSFGLPWKRAGKTTYILTVHDLIPLTPYREYMNGFLFWLYKLSIRISIRRADAIVAISDRTKDDLLQHFPGINKKLSVLYDGIDDPPQMARDATETLWKSLAYTYNLEPKKFIFYFGGFGHRRNIPLLVTAFAVLREEKEQYRDLKLVISGRIAGAKDQALANYHQLKALVAELQLEDHVVFLDYISPQDKAVLLRYCRLFCSVSLYEGFGLTPIEALQSRQLTIFSRVGIWSSYDGLNKFIVDDPKSVGEIEQHMAHALATTDYIKDDDYQELIKFISQFSWQKMGKQYYELYDKMKT